MPDKGKNNKKSKSKSAQKASHTNLPDMNTNTDTKKTSRND